MLATLFITEELAPFQNADIKEVPVRIYPKLALKYKFALPPASFVEGWIPEKVAAQYSDPTEK